LIRLGILASGGGSNLQAILDACAADRIDARVAVVLSNVPGAGALARAEKAGVAIELLPSKGIADRAVYDAQVVDRLKAHGVELVCLAGYMRIVTPTFLRAFGPSDGTRGCPRVVNIHPGLLPSFPGLHAQKQALDYGARFAGCTVHFVDEGTDTGPIIAQAIVPVLPDDTEPTLAARILAEEHRLYPQSIQWFAQGRLSLEGRRVRIDGGRQQAPFAHSNPCVE
jgi:phosphoribosylglycinamide formyltransferase-1